MNFRQLEIFCAVARLGSVSEAARSLRVSQPAVSKTLRLLREETGLQLFQRVGGRMRPSAEAEQLYLKARHIFVDLDRIKDFVVELRNVQVGKLRIAALATLSTTFVPTAIKRLIENRRKVDIDIRSLPSHQVIESLARDEADIGIFNEPTADPKVRTEAICETEVVCILPENHPLAARSSISPLDLAHENLIAFDPGTSVARAVASVFRDCSIELAPRLIVNQTAVAVALAKAGVGIAIVDPFHLFGASLPAVAVRPIFPSVSLCLRIGYPSERPVSRLASEFATLLRQASEELSNSAPFRLEILR